MDLFAVIVVLGLVGLIALGYRPFIERFQEKFGRSFIHWSNLSLILVIIFSASCMSGSTTWTVIFYIAWAVLIGLGISYIIKYGFLWGLGVWFYNILTVALVITVINAISNLFKKDNK